MVIHAIKKNMERKAYQCLAEGGAAQAALAVEYRWPKEQREEFSPPSPPSPSVVRRRRAARAGYASDCPFSSEPLVAAAANFEG